jgi:hypothetical protein
MTETSEKSSDSSAHRPGETLREGRYAIVGKLGEGGQATTFEAVDKREGRHVTVKRFEVKGASSWKEVELAEREAKVLAHLTHPNLPVYVEHFEEGGNLYLVTEHIEGDTVASLRAGGAIEERDVLRFLADASAALDYLHDRTPPIVHRDIKPSNVIRRRDGSFAIIDFGAVRDRLKATGTTVVGTFGYMAPEQLQGRAMPASDVYAVGTTAVAMLTGREPEDLPHKGLAIDVEAALGPRARPALVRALAAMVTPDPDVRAPRIAPLLAELGAETPRTSDPPRPAHRIRDAAGTEAERVVTEVEEQVKRAVEMLGDKVRRAVTDAADGRRPESRRDVKRAARDVRRAVKEARREAKREIRREQAMEVRPPDALPRGGPALLVVMALSLAQIAVLLALKVVVPVVLYVFSAMFLWSVPGRAMRDAARAVSGAGSRAAAVLGRVREAVRGGAPVDAHAPTTVHRAGSVDPHAATVVDTVAPSSAGTARVRVGDAFEDDARARAEDEDEEAAEPSRAQRRR